MVLYSYASTTGNYKAVVHEILHHLSLFIVVFSISLGV